MENYLQSDVVDVANDIFATFVQNLFGDKNRRIGKFKY